MTEVLDLTYLEKFRDSNYPFLYWIDSPKLSEQVANEVISAGNFGLETGFGRQPTKLFLVDHNINWLLTELKVENFVLAKRDLKLWWKEIPASITPSKFKMMALHTASTQEIVGKAQVLVYRNLDYRNMWVPDFNELKSGQRIVFIVDSEHVGETRYKKFLWENGYNPDTLSNRQEHLSHAYSKDFQTLVLDLTKN